MTGKEGNLHDRFFTLSLDMLCIAGFDGYFKELNPAWERTFGFTEAELKARPFIEFIHPADRQATLARAREIIDGATVAPFENRFRCRDGSYRWLSWKANVFRDEELFYAVARDVTERRQWEKRLVYDKRQLEQQYRRQAALAEIGLAINQPHELQRVLQRIAELTTELLPASAGASVLLWNAAKEEYAYSASTVPGQKPQTGALRARTQGGATRWIIDHQQPLAVSDVNHDRFSSNQLTVEYSIRAYAGVPLLADGEVLGVLYALDEAPRPYSAADLDFMTALASRAALAIIKVRLYERLRAANKLLEQKSAQLQQRSADLEARNAELDAFTHTVAHDLKSPLALIVGFASLLESGDQTALDADQRLALRTITQTSFRMRNIIDELLLLASVGKQEVEMRPLNMAAIVAETQTRLQYMFEEHKAEIKLPQKWPVALGHGPWIEEVWTNYLSNGIKYGGRPPQLELGAAVQPDGMARFWVTDNGPGIAPEDQARLFAPFTQLSQVRAEGHGLGLSIVHRIIHKCKGQVGVDSEIGAGSTFWFTLPAGQVHG